jgi:hypothetical protein
MGTKKTTTSPPVEKFINGQQFPPINRSKIQKKKKISFHPDCIENILVANSSHLSTGKN